MENSVEQLIERYHKALQRKQSWESHWRECYEYALPQRENVSSPYAGGY